MPPPPRSSQCAALPSMDDAKHFFDLSPFFASNSARRRQLLARGSSAGKGPDEEEEQAASGMLAMLGYELQPFIDAAEAWRPPQEYRLPRYVAARNRVVGGLVVTVKLLAQVPLAQCTKRFARVGNDCYDDGCGAPRQRF